MRPPNLARALTAASGVVIVLLFGRLIEVLAFGLPIGPDLPWHDLLATHHPAFLLLLANGFAEVGGTLGSTVIVAIIAIVLFVLGRRRDGLVLALAMLLSSTVAQLVKAVIVRPRPLDGVYGAAPASFPSGHVTAAATFTIALVLIFGDVFSVVLAAVWIPLMAWSRTQLLVHWVTDTVAGALLGASVAVLVFALLPRPRREDDIGFL